MRGYLSSLLHSLFGFITVLSVIVHPVLPVLCFASFMIYEYDEERHLMDYMHEEVAEFSTGMSIAILMLLCLKLMKALTI